MGSNPACQPMSNRPQLSDAFERAKGFLDDILAEIKREDLFWIQCAAAKQTAKAVILLSLSENIFQNGALFVEVFFQS